MRLQAFPVTRGQRNVTLMMPAGAKILGVSEDRAGIPQVFALVDETLPFATPRSLLISRDGSSLSGAPTNYQEIGRFDFDGAINQVLEVADDPAQPAEEPPYPFNRKQKFLAKIGVSESKFGRSIA